MATPATPQNIASFSCYNSDGSSCPTTPSSHASESTPKGQGQGEIDEAYHHALQDENGLLRNELESFMQKMEEMQRQLDEFQREKEQQQEKSHKQWIAENLEEAQHVIDSIVGIKGITEDPLNAAIKLGISHPQQQERGQSQNFNQRWRNYYGEEEQPEHQEPSSYLHRVSISSSVVPSNEELYGY
jgi:predicted nuclease with TOPRIM domain